MSLPADPRGGAGMSAVNERNIANLIGRCRHFTGTVDVTCKAGLRYTDVCGGDAPGWARRLPCITKYAEPDAATCEERSPYTREEAIADLRERDRQTENVIAARRAIMKQVGDRRNVQVSIQCPVCAAKTPREASVLTGIVFENGHVHAKCSARGCVNWME